MSAELLTRAAELFGVAVEDMVSASQHYMHVNARAALALVLRERGATYTTIAQLINRSPTTIHPALSRARARMVTSKLFAERVAKLREETR